MKWCELVPISASGVIILSLAAVMLALIAWALFGVDSPRAQVILLFNFTLFGLSPLVYAYFYVVVSTNRDELSRMRRREHTAHQQERREMME